MNILGAEAVALIWSAVGTLQTLMPTMSMSADGDKADMPHICSDVR
jgi:hypothetical protein